MHPTADTAALIFGNRSGRRVMPGVRSLSSRRREMKVRVESGEGKRLRAASGAWFSSAGSGAGSGGEGGALRVPRIVIAA
jgi:hypothetical protein